MIHTPRSLPAPSRPQPLAVPIIRRWAPLLMAALLSACAAAEAPPTSETAASQPYEKTDRGVIVHPSGKDAADVRLEVVSDGIIRVSADPDGDFERTQSLMRVGDDGAAPAFEVTTSDDGKVRLATARVIAEVAPDTGRVSFLDKNGKPILSEVAGGRTFAPLKVEGKDYLSVRQRFESPDEVREFDRGRLEGLDGTAVMIESTVRSGSSPGGFGFRLRGGRSGRALGRRRGRCRLPSAALRGRAGLGR